MLVEVLVAILVMSLVAANLFAVFNNVRKLSVSNIEEMQALIMVNNCLMQKEPIGMRKEFDVMGVANFTIIAEEDRGIEGSLFVTKRCEVFWSGRGRDNVYEVEVRYLQPELFK